MYTKNKSLTECGDHTLGIELREGLERMIEFERELRSYSREALILFIVLHLEESRFGKALEILDSLEPLPEGNKSVTY